MNYYYFYKLVFLLLGNLIFLFFLKESCNSALCMQCVQSYLTLCDPRL